MKKIEHLIKKVCKLKYCEMNQFQELSGKLQHSLFRIPGGKLLFLRIYRGMKMTEEPEKITLYLVAELKDWRKLVNHLADNPTQVQIIVGEYTYYLQYIDAYKLLTGGGVITPGIHSIQPFALKYICPKYIQNTLMSYKNPKGRLTINNIELEGLVLRCLVLEYVVDYFMFRHIGCFCENTSAVAWASSGSPCNC